MRGFCGIVVASQLHVESTAGVCLPYFCVKWGNHGPASIVVVLPQTHIISERTLKPCDMVRAWFSYKKSV